MLNKKGLIFILSGPAGVGKTTLAQKLITEFPHIVQSISYTTREKRPQEVEGKDYFFISEEDFFQKERAHTFLESVALFGNHYGTSRAWVEGKLSEGKHVLLVIDTQGAKKIMQSESGNCKYCYIFVTPPSKEALKERLLLRNQDSLESISTRLALAEQEMQEFKFYEYLIVNRDIDASYDALRSIVIAEEHRI